MLQHLRSNNFATIFNYHYINNTIMYQTTVADHKLI